MQTDIIILRRWQEADAPIILSWIKNKTEFRKWSADRYPNYPATADDMVMQYDADNIHPLTAEDKEGNIIGHIMIRIPNSAQPQNVRLGFIIVDDSLRGKGYGKRLILQTIDYAKRNLNATQISLGVFLNNPSALHCYEATGFKAIGKESYPIDGEIWEGVEMEYTTDNTYKKMNIRLEQPKDYREVENLTREAFWNIYKPGCVEHFVLNQYRNNPDFIPELDFILESSSPALPEGEGACKPRIIGHVMFSRAEIEKDDGSVLPAWTFGPISIHPDYKRKGYGLKLLNYSLEKAREIGIGVICMEGNIDFYKHAGFQLASSLKIHYYGEPKENDVPYFLALELIPGYLDGIEGTYHTPQGYFVAMEKAEEFEQYEATFPVKEKHFQEGQLPQFCLSCGMPLTKDEDCGKNADGSINYDYCQHCYKEGHN